MLAWQLTVRRKGWKQGDREGSYFSCTGKKSIVAWTQALVVEMRKRVQVQDIFWKKSQQTLTIDCIQEKEMERSEMTPRFGVCPVVSMVIVLARDHWRRAGLGEWCSPWGKLGKFPPQGQNFSPWSFYFLLICSNLRKEPMHSTLNSTIRKSLLHGDA